MTTWKKWLNGRGDKGEAELAELDLERLQSQLHHALRECTGPMAQRMRWRIDDTFTAEALWLLREEIFQLVAGEFCQEEAVHRVNALLPAFSAWLPGRMLTRL